MKNLILTIAIILTSMFTFGQDVFGIHNDTNHIYNLSANYGSEVTDDNDSTLTVKFDVVKLTLKNGGDSVIIGNLETIFEEGYKFNDHTIGTPCTFTTLVEINVDDNIITTKGVADNSYKHIYHFDFSDVMETDSIDEGDGDDSGNNPGEEDNKPGHGSSNGEDEEENTTSVINNVINDFKVYPNPVVDILNIGFYSQNSVNVTILSMDGRVMYQTSSYHSISINISDYPRGMYIVRVNDEIKKIIKQ